MSKIDRRYMSMAEIWAENSHAKRAKVGALIVKDRMIISDGYNGTPSGFENECENPVYSRALGYPPDPDEEDLIEDFKPLEPIGWETKPHVLHAEANAITKIAKSTNSSLGSTLYVLMAPCMECSKLIIQSGIVRVVYRDQYRKSEGIELLKKAGVKVECLG